MQTLKKKLIALDKKKIKLQKGLEFIGKPQAVLTITKNKDNGYYYVNLSSPELGINKQFGIGSQDKRYAEAQFDINLKKLIKGEYCLSYHANFRTPLSGLFDVEEI